MNDSMNGTMIRVIDDFPGEARNGAIDEAASDRERRKALADFLDRKSVV